MTIQSTRRVVDTAGMLTTRPVHGSAPMSAPAVLLFPRTDTGRDDFALGQRVAHAGNDGDSQHAQDDREADEGVDARPVVDSRNVVVQSLVHELEPDVGEDDRQASLEVPEL